MSTATFESFQSFESDARAQGFDEVLVREWAPSAVVGVHTHPFAVQAVVTRGEFWLTVGAEVQHVRAGEGFSLDRGVEHAERYGSEGATFWVARRHGPAAAAA